MELKIKRIDKDLPLPEYKTAGAVAFDLYVREDTTIAPGSIGFVPNNIIAMIPEGFALFIYSRSSTPKRHNLSIPHGVGVIDCDYCGPEDELKTMVYNMTESEITIHKGDRISQAIILPIPKVTITEVEEVGAFTRGGFGSTSEGDQSIQ